ncbi:MAG: efflux transporter outer membrane subunit [Halioglobus sp.]|nr:efflux transporter outer membrane subunit [Halioglobus sp.]
MRVCGRLVLLGALLLPAACGNLAGPDYQRPEGPHKDTWSAIDAVRVSAVETIRPDWWRNFNDPYLDTLLAQAISSNYDLQVLAARTGVAEAAIGQANAARLPTVDASVGGRQRGAAGGPVNQAYSQAAAIGWEVDLWGKLKKGVQAQEAELKASEADWRAGYLTLAADLSSTYFRLRQFDEQIDRQRLALERNRRIAGIYESLYDEGVVPRTQLLKQQAEVDGLENDLLELQRLRALAEHALATLTGTPAGELRVPAGHLSTAVDLVAVPAGLPASLLSRRPDIVAAEYRVLQAHELVGQARLARLPSISLTAGSGTTSPDLGSLLSAWTFGLSQVVSIPIFDPAVQARLDTSEASAQVAEQEYRAAVIRAFEDVENALVNLTHRREQRRELLQQAQKLRVIARQVEAQLGEGLVSQLEVLEAERSVLAAEQQLLLNRQLILSATVELYQALGGGWPADVVQSAERRVEH